jgi:chromate transport protein ChrA
LASETYTLYLVATTGVCLANVLLLGSLAWFYHQGYKELRSRFVLGLLVFAAFLLTQNILYIGFYMMDFRSFEYAAKYVLTANLAQTLGLVALTIVSWK